MQQTTAVYENTDGQLLINGCIVAHRFFTKMFLSTFSSEYRAVTHWENGVGGEAVCGGRTNPATASNF